MKLSDFNKLLRAIKQEYGDIDIVLNLNNSGIMIKSLIVKETTAGNIALVNPNASQGHRITAIGTTLKIKEFTNIETSNQISISG